MEKNIPQFSVLPKHIGIIMDGNGRWAKQRNLPRYKGHIEGAKTFRKIGEFAADVGVRCMTFYAFSTENWKRPQEEVDAIMQLFREYLREAEELWNAAEASSAMISVGANPNLLDIKPVYFPPPSRTRLFPLPTTVRWKRRLRNSLYGQRVAIRVSMLT